MTEPTFLLTVPESGRADALLAAAVDGLTRSAAQRWMEEGRVTLCGVPVKKNARLDAGAVLAVTPPQPEEVDVVPQNIPLDVVYEDNDVIVVNKPVGMVVHPAPGHPDGTLVNALLYHCKDSLSGINGQLRPGIVHRIDRDTSGLIIAAKNDRAHLALAEQLQEHSLFRLYHAVAVGGFREESGTVDAPIARHRTDRKKMAVCRPGEGRDAVTHWQVVDSRTRLFPYHLPSGDGPHPSDPRPHGVHRPPPAGGHGVRREKAVARSGGPVPSRRPAHLHPPVHRGAHDGGSPSARLVHRRPHQAGAGIIPYKSRTPAGIV